MSSSYRALSEVAETEYYITKREDLKKAFAEVENMREKLVQHYEAFLTASEMQRADALVWGKKSADEFSSAFLVILLCTYNVFDKSHRRYTKLLRIVKKENPEWLDTIENDHERKLKMCKVEVFPLKKGVKTL